MILLYVHHGSSYPLPSSADSFRPTIKDDPFVCPSRIILPSLILGWFPPVPQSRMILLSVHQGSYFRLSSSANSSRPTIKDDPFVCPSRIILSSLPTVLRYACQGFHLHKVAFEKKLLVRRYGKGKKFKRILANIFLSWFVRHANMPFLSNFSPKNYF